MNNFVYINQHKYFNTQSDAMSLIERVQSLELPVGEADTNLVSEIAYNVLYGIVALDLTDVAFFVRHKKALRTLVSKAPWKRRLNALTPALFDRLKDVAIRYLNG